MASLIRCPTVLAGPRLEAIDDGAVLVDEGRVSWVGAARDAPSVAAEELPAGHCLVPGFIDAHVHIGFADPAAVLRGGVTVARDLAWPPGEIWPLARRSAAPDHPGPLLLAAGQMLTVEGGYPTRARWAPPGTGRPVSSLDDARRAVEAQAAAGACVVKVAVAPSVGPTLDGRTLAEIVAAARDRDLKVTAHADGGAALETVLDAGVTELAHLPMGTERIPDGTIEHMIELDVTVVPTLSIRSGTELDVGIENLRRFADAGGRIVYGTDLGNEGPRPGIDPAEIAGMAAAGLRPLQILASATTESAAYLGLSSKGAIEVDFDADLVALRGDPTTDPSALTSVAAVWRMGRRVR